MTAHGAHVGADADAERGSTTVLVLGVVGVGAVLLLVLAALGGVTQARAQAQAAADLGAISAATAAARPHGADPCYAAASAVVQAGAVLVSCSLAGADAVVVARVPTAVGDAVATARAGPAPPGTRPPAGDP